MNSRSAWSATSATGAQEPLLPGPVYGNGFSRVDLSRESARHRELSGSQRQFIGFDFFSTRPVN